VRSLISDGGWNGQLNLRTGAGLAPKIQFGVNPLGALTHASQSPVPGDSAFLQQLGIDTCAVVTNAETKHLVIVSDLHFNSSGMRVPKSVSQEFERNPADLIIGSWRQGSSLSLLDQIENW
jgi:hypothetical protein